MSTLLNRPYYPQGTEEHWTGSDVLEPLPPLPSRPDTNSEIIKDVDTTVQEIDKLLTRVRKTETEGHLTDRNLGLLVRLVSAGLEGLTAEEVAQLLGWRPEAFRKILHGQRKVQPSRATRVIEVAEILRLLNRVLERPAIGRWFQTQIPALNDQTPIAAIKSHQAARVLSVVKGYLEPVY